MGTLSRKSLWIARRGGLVLVLLSLAAATGARGQWRIVAPNVVKPHFDYTDEGAMSFRDGILWAGYENLASSTDSGKTWIVTPNLPSLQIAAISFPNRDTGIVSGEKYFNSDPTTYSTSDGGQNWAFANYDFAQVYCGTQTTAYAIGAGISGSFWQSLDGGRSWNVLEDFRSIDLASDFGVKSGATFIGLAQNWGVYPAVGYVSISIDSGIHWASTNGELYADSYSIGLDSCDASTLYVVSENVYTKMPDNLCHIFRSSDQGATWQATFSATEPYLSGSFSCSPHAEYAATISDGILRSTDHGRNWKNIGGPGNVVDSRCICAISDNIIFALDANGNIWATFNSGGDSIRIAASSTNSLSALPMQLFQSDTIQCESLTRSVVFNRSGCYPPSVLSWSIIGADSASYSAGNLSAGDSILVTLSAAGATNGDQHAQLVLVLDDGSRDTVSLAGFINTGASPIRLQSQDEQTDTLGATVAVPITISGLTRPEDVDLILHYDGSVDYLGSFAPSGALLYKAGEQWPGRSSLHISSAAPGVVAGYAKFNVFSDSNEDAHATFDSLDILTAISPCEYSSAPAATSTILPPKGCGIPILSQLVHLGKEPVLSVRPNPAAGSVWITASGDIPDATLAIYDMLGSERSEQQIPLRANMPTEIMLPAGAGVYTVAVRSSLGLRTLRVVRER